jgi:hypothetical protein
MNLARIADAKESLSRVCQFRFQAIIHQYMDRYRRKKSPAVAAGLFQEYMQIITTL